MADPAPVATRIRLARSVPRLLALPAALAVGGIAIAVASIVALDWPAQLLAILGAVSALKGIVSIAYLLSVRLEVQESAIRVTWLGGERTYPLAPGPVTRVRLRGERASSLRSRGGWRGWTVGPARLRDEEDIHVVRLAPTPSAILVPTELGRLAVAAASDDQLLDALSRAARARQRLEALSDLVPAPPEPAPETEPEPPPIAEAPEPEPPPLTGIERALIEQRLAEERAAAMAVALSTPAQPAAKTVAVTVSEPEATESVAPAPAERRGRRLGRPRLTGRVLRRPRPSVAFVLLPVVGAGIAWAAGIASGRMPEAGTDLARLTSLALVLAGPATSVGAVMALAYWPRMVGVVVAGGLAASVFIGRALIGG